MPLCSSWGWGSYLTWNGSHIPSQHMEGVWQPSTFICYGWAYRSIIMPLPLSLHVITQIWEVSWNPASLLGCKGCHSCAAVEALTHHGMIPTFTPSIWKVFDNRHMLWMGIWIHHQSSCYYHHMYWPRCGKSAEILHRCWASKDAMPLCRGWGLYLYPSCNDSHIPFKHMEGVWKPSYAVGWVCGSIIMPISLHVLTQIWEVSWNPASLLGYKGCHCAVIEALYWYGIAQYRKWYEMSHTQHQ